MDLKSVMPKGYESEGVAEHDSLERSLETQRACSTANIDAEERESEQKECGDAEEAAIRREWLRSPEMILIILVITAQNGYSAKGFKNLSRAFRYDEQLWDAIKDRCGPNGVTHLHIAAREGDLERVEWLLKRSANVNASQSEDGMTPLMYASGRGHLEVARLLIDKGANVNAFAKGKGGTALSFAIGKDFVFGTDYHLEVARLLLGRGARVGSGHLMRASKNGHLEVAKLLIGYGADVGVGEYDGTSPLMVASEFGHLEIARLLLNKGADVNVARSSDGITALIRACLHGHLGIARLLIGKGAKVNAAQTDSGFTALMCASIKGHLPLITLLLESGANKAARDRRGCTALSHAISPEVRLALEE